MSMKLSLLVITAVFALANAHPGPPTPPPINDMIIQLADRVQNEINLTVDASSAPANVKETVRQTALQKLADCQAAAKETDIMGFVRCTIAVNDYVFYALLSY